MTSLKMTFKEGTMYYLILTIGLILALLNRRFLFWIYASIITTMLAIRYGVGSDYFSYEFLYSRLQPTWMLEYKFGIDEQEQGFRVLGAFIKEMGLTYQQYLTVFAIVTIFFTALIMLKYSRNPTLSLMIYFSFYYLTWPMSGIRQALAMAIGMYFLLQYIEKKNTVKFVIIALILAQVHSSALVLLIFMVISHLNLNKKKLTAISLFSIGLSILPLGLLISNLTVLPVFNRIIPYMDLDMSLSLSILDFQSISRLVFLLFAFIVYERVSSQGPIQKTIINLYIMSFALYFAMQFSELAAARMSVYGRFLDTIIIVNVLYLLKQSKAQILYLNFVFILCAAYLTKDLNSMTKDFVDGHNRTVTPYVHTFNKEDYQFSIDRYTLID